MLDLSVRPDFGLGWLDASGPHAGVVLSTRVRLARNLQGHPFGNHAREGEREAIFDEVLRAARQHAPLVDATTVDLSTTTGLTRRVLLERHLISRELAGEETTPRPGTGLIMAPGEATGVMVNEEDHLRLQGILSGLRLEEAYGMVEALDDALGGSLAFAFHQEFGYLTSCPTNVGTGLRASILIHLPALVLTKEIGKVLQGINQVGLTFRGLYGEGSEVVGNFFQISNQTTLGKSEEDLIEHLQTIVAKVIQYEEEARGVLRRDAPAVMEDKIWRAYGLLRYARALSFEEVMNLLSGLRLGVGMKLLPGLSVYTLNKIMVYAQAAHLEQAAGRTLSDEESGLHRATFVRRVLATEGDVSADPDETRNL